MYFRIYADLVVSASNREMAIGNTFGATALSSYGGFWLSFAIILTPGGFQIVESLESEGGVAAFHNSFGLFLFVCSPLSVMDIRVGAQLQEDQTMIRTKLTPYAGMVRLHQPPRHLHPEIHRGLLLSLLHPRPRFSLPRNRLHHTQCRGRAQSRLDYCRWCLWSPGRSFGLV